MLFANDDFFAGKENLLKVEEAIFITDKYTDRGKWMDGWESRRRRTSGHDFCIVKLGLPGRIHGFDVDTSHFTGNYPEACSLDALWAPEGADLDAIGTETSPWIEVLPRTPLRGGSHNHFPLNDRRAFTHVRLQIFPDGGVARLRVHGEVVADWHALGATKKPVDLCALGNGGLVLASSDAYFGSHQNLLMPGQGSSMKDGWETKRSRRPGSDWVIVRLGTRGVITEAELDTSHFKGNFPDGASLELCDDPAAELESLLDPKRDWHPLLAETPLAAHTRHRFSKELLSANAATHVRLRITPDGGISRMRLVGTPAAPEALLTLNRDAPEKATLELLRCCGSRRWAEGLAALRPFASHLDLFSNAERMFDELTKEDWLEAFTAHPRIGDREALAARFVSTRSWTEGEQAGAIAASDALLDELAQANAAYEKRFGHVFLICATGLPAFRMLASLKERMTNPRDIELSSASDEQRRITRLRLGKLLT